MSAAKPKIAILGGGIAALTVALRLTEDSRWRERFESITVYQMGWRLGGKGASGRGDHDRIEEHGLHVWLGFYENAFSNIQRVYADLKRPAGTPLATWQDAFRGQDWIGVADQQAATWHACMQEVPHRRGTPGDGVPPPSLQDCLRAAVEWTTAKARVLLVDEQDTMVLRETDWLQAYGLNDALADQLQLLLQRIDLRLQGTAMVGGGTCLLRLVGLAAAIALSLIADRVFSQADLARLEDVDLAKWLGDHGAPKSITDLEQNAFLRGLYEFAFAYEDGDTSRPAFAAAPAIRTIYRMCFTYKGSVFYKMDAGMGDTVFAPIFLALRDRGVAFEFFHRVDHLALSADRKSIERIVMGRQATVRQAPYDPLVDITFAGSAHPLPCWPAQPVFQRLVEGDALQAAKVDLESFWTPWKDVGQRELRAGQEFDIAVFGISLGSVPFLCRELIEQSSAWRDMVANVQTVATQAAQLWLARRHATTGPLSHEPILDAWVQPLNTWADMSGLLARKRENWPAGAQPQALHYFCGPLKGFAPLPGNGSAPSEALGEVQRHARDLLGNLPMLWGEPVKPEEVMSTFLRANIDPSQRYVLSVPGSARHRLRADQSGFSNLVVTGDWTLNGYNGGCIEAATWSGMQAANVLLGRPIDEGIVYG